MGLVGLAWLQRHLKGKEEREKRTARKGKGKGKEKGKRGQKGKEDRSRSFSTKGKRGQVSIIFNDVHVSLIETCPLFRSFFVGLPLERSWNKREPFASKYVWRVVGNTTANPEALAGVTTEVAMRNWKNLNYESLPEFREAGQLAALPVRPLRL